MRVGEIGKIINLITTFDLTGASVLSVVLKKPNGEEVTKTGSSVTAPAENNEATGLISGQYIQYTTEAGDIDIDGDWQIYGVYEDTTPKKYFSDNAAFSVSE